jgi:hypothetical protein
MPKLLHFLILLQRNIDASSQACRSARSWRSISRSLSSLRSATPPKVNDKVKLTEVEVETLSPMRRLSVNKPLSIAYGTGELPAMIATSRDYHAYRSESHLPGDLIPIAKTNHFTILDELRLPDSHLTRQVLQLATYSVT